MHNRNDEDRTMLIEDIDADTIEIIREFSPDVGLAVTFLGCGDGIDAIVITGKFSSIVKLCQYLDDQDMGSNGVSKVDEDAIWSMCT